MKPQWLDNFDGLGSHSFRFCEPGGNSCSSNISRSSFWGWTLTVFSTHCRASDCSGGVRAAKAVRKSRNVRCNSSALKSRAAKSFILLSRSSSCCYSAHLSVSSPILVSNRSQIFAPVVTNLVFFLVPFRRLRFPECLGDFPFQFVEVDLLHAVAHLCQSILQPLALGLSMLFSAPTIEA